MISFHPEKIKFILKDKTLIRKWIESVCRSYKRKAGDITYIFCSDKHLLTINREYLKHDTLTDIITFDYSGNDDSLPVSGDIFISVERVKENAKKFERPFNEELHRVMIHGILHLLGHTDKQKAEKEKMTMAENKALRKLTGLK